MVNAGAGARPRPADLTVASPFSQVFFLARALWPAYLGYSANWLFMGGVCIYMFFGFVTGSMRYIPLSLNVGVMALSISSVSAGVGYSVLNFGDPVENNLSAHFFLITGVGYFFFTCALSLFPKYPDLLMMFFPMYTMTVNFSLWGVMLSANTVALLCIWAVGFSIFVYRFWVYFKAEKLIRKMRVVYDDVWRKVLIQPNTVRDLCILNDVIGRIRMRTGGKTAAQFNLRVDDGRRRSHRTTSSHPSSTMESLFGSANNALWGRGNATMSTSLEARAK